MGNFMGQSVHLYDEVSELGQACGIFYAGCNRCRILFCCDCYYVLNDTTRSVLYAHELYVCIQMFMDAMRDRVGGVACE